MPELVYLKYESLDDVLKVVVYSSQSMLGVVPMPYYISYKGRHIVFLQTGAVGNTIIHYTVMKDKPQKKFIQLKRMTGDYSFVDGIGLDAQSIYVPVLKLESSTLEFPL